MGSIGIIPTKPNKQSAPPTPATAIFSWLSLHGCLLRPLREKENCTACHIVQWLIACSAVLSLSVALTGAHTRGGGISKSAENYRGSRWMGRSLWCPLRMVCGETDPPTTSDKFIYIYVCPVQRFWQPCHTMARHMGPQYQLDYRKDTLVSSFLPIRWLNSQGATD